MIICALEIKWNKIFWGYEAVLMTIQGLAGCIIATLFFFFRASYGKLKLADCNIKPHTYYIYGNKDGKHT